MKKNAYDIKAGETFSYGGMTYTATKDARGEFRPYIEVVDGSGRGTPGEIVLEHGAEVELA